jgi:hypothetical protein
VPNQGVLARPPHTSGGNESPVPDEGQIAGGTLGRYQTRGIRHEQFVE